LPPEVIQDILTKFSFLDPADIKKWVKTNPNAKVQQGAEQGASPEEFGGGGGGIGGAPPMGGGMEQGGITPPAGEEASVEGAPEAPPEENPLAQDITGSANESHSKTKYYMALEEQVKFEEDQRKILKRYQEGIDIISEAAIKTFGRVDEAQMNNRHYKYARIESCNLPMYHIFQKPTSPAPLEESDQQKRATDVLDDDGSLNWSKIKEMLKTPLQDMEDQGGMPKEKILEDIDSDAEHSRNIQGILNP
jgi:hypothetical protein